MAVNVITGAKAVIKITPAGGTEKIAGYATGISISEVTFNGRVDSLGFVDTREIVPIGRNVSATVNFIRIFNTDNDNFDSLDTMNDTDEVAVVNSTTGTSATGQQRTDDVLTFPTFDLTVYDAANSLARPQTEPPPAANANDVEIYTLKGCRISSQNIVVDRGSMMGVQCTIDATHLVRHAPPSEVTRP
jgi:hypothetical protein